MTLNLMTIKGYAKMGVFQCNNYPICPFDEHTIQKSIRPRNINRFSSLTIPKDSEYDNSPINKKQTLFFVECQKMKK